MDDLFIKNGITIPAHELEITASRAGGPGGQHVNKTSTRITLRWNIENSHAITPEQKERIITKLKPELTTEGDIIIHSSSSRSQSQNKYAALEKLATKLRNALRVEKKRMQTGIPAKAKERRLQAKKQHGDIKKMRKKITFDQ